MQVWSKTAKNHIRVDQWVEDIGSTLDYKRKGFNEVVEQIELGQVRRLIITYQFDKGYLL